MQHVTRVVMMQHGVKLIDCFSPRSADDEIAHYRRHGFITQPMESPDYVRMQKEYLLTVTTVRVYVKPVTT